MLSFDNTANAFSGKTDNDLNRSYWLFKMVSNPGLVNFGRSFTDFAIKAHLPINGIIKATIFKQFCGGENITECLKTVAELGKYNVGSILDYSVEGKTSEAEFDETAAEIIRTLKEAANNPHIPFGVFKPTGIGRIEVLEKVSSNAKLNADEEQAWQNTKRRFDSICKAAFDYQVQVLVDAEETWTQVAVDALVRDMMEKYNKQKAIVFNTAQMYRRDRLAYLDNLLKDAQEKNYFIGMKLVRGAYMEKERDHAAKGGYQSPINDTKADTDNEYNSALEFCIKHIDRISICAGTHNENSSELLVKLMQQNNIPANNPHVWFSQLLGMSDHISYNIAKEGYNVAKYVPYGPIKNVLPYLIRRAQENTSVKGQTGRELSLIIKEKQRRTSVKKSA
ncbi:MAG TPA: proline dehydrogenase family protein [Bacteroidia bacterium]|jgi:proline dehydrogenase|nr:proline dehydrogenase family protein [Bacteroidia bacterium]